ncbi:hypothetical protein C8J56DRAFT_1103512 [Mycena floridula]|nr:hypothetical protein C8J56DRAFT_1103512 [Mycena floridula]
MVLMDKENERLRKQLHAKKNKVRRSYNTGKPCLMTSKEMLQTLLEEEQKKLMKILHRAMAPTLKDIKKKLMEFEAAKKKAASRSRGCSRGRGHGCGNPGPETDNEPVRGRGRSQGRRRAHADGRGRSCGRGRGIAESGDHLQSDSDGDDNDSAGSSRLLTPAPSPSPSPLSTPSLSRIASPCRNPEIQVGPDPDLDDGDETEVTTFNGHQWVQNRRNLEFQVLWSDKDITWEPLSNVNDCSAMDDYLERHDLSDPLLLSKQKYLIDSSLKSSN